jgi:hypothetical protein
MDCRSASAEALEDCCAVGRTTQRPALICRDRKIFLDLIFIFSEPAASLASYRPVPTEGNSVEHTIDRTAQHDAEGTLWPTWLEWIDAIAANLKNGAAGD